MGMMKEFKDFAMRGNLVDTAVAFVMGGAFGKVVSGFVDGMVMPLVGMLTSGVDFKELKWVIQSGVAEVKDAAGTVVTPAVAEVSVKYGAFITVIIDFLIVAFAIFMVVKAMNRMKKAEPAPPPPGPSNEEKLLMEIRDALRK
jgi:large conductance mechanosensitive channel